ncbi:hypothetical protein GCM10011316_02900 [Roseibium aquae]|uniref:Guanylate cyclase domain-containing protein n=1 Tax=Roseibium aquae TaxID=1323746 RepID=A0A916T779_9HYPH|nr:hypothetical protein GCM10011316_02900 [Roseibium aquae]
MLAILVALPVAGRLDPILGDFAVLNLAPDDSGARDRIVVVTITEDTLAGFPYRSPIDREFLAELLLTLDRMDPASVGLDILLDGPSEPAKDAALLGALDTIQTPAILASVSDSFLTVRQSAYLKEVLEDRVAGSVELQRDDADGILRHLPKRQDDTPLFTEAVAGKAFPVSHFDNRIRYQAHSGAFAKYPAHTVAFLPEDWFAEKHVLIGTDLPGVDRHPTPLASLEGAASGSLAGIEVHAHVLAQLLSGRTLPVPTFAQTIGLLSIITVVAALGFSLVNRPKTFFVWFAAALVSYLGLAFAGMHEGVFVLPVLGPAVAALTCVFLLALVKWRHDRMERAFVVSAFEKYVSPAVVRRLASGEVPLALGGEKRLVTYIFTDLEGFTSLSEKLPPDQVADILNGYLDAVCDVVFKHGATLDKLIGDAVVCFLGAPEDNPKQAETAVALALELDATAEQYRASLQKRGVRLGVTRIGVHSGEAVIGNFGGGRFFDYTGVGDTVNTAARLEGANKYLGSRICVSEAVASACPNRAFRPLGDLVLKGRSQGLRCHEPLSETEAEEDWVADYREAFKLLGSGSAQAQTLFERVLSYRPQDGPSRLHLKRLRNGETGATVVLSEK